MKKEILKATIEKNKTQGHWLNQRWVIIQYHKRLSHEKPKFFRVSNYGIILK